MQVGAANPTTSNNQWMQFDMGKVRQDQGYRVGLHGGRLLHLGQYPTPSVTEFKARPHHD